MNPWLESIGVALLAGAGVLLGHWFSRRPKPYSLVGYVIPLSLIIVYVVVGRHAALAFVPPFSWMMGWTKFALMGFIGTMVLTTPLCRLAQKRDRLVEYRLFRDTSELKAPGLVLAVVKFNFMLAHYVTVLEVTDRDVVVGDPLSGKTTLSHEEFRKKWRFTGVVLKRKG